MSSGLKCHVLMCIIVLSLDKLQVVTGTANLKVSSCTIGNYRKQDCGYPTEQECMDNKCCWKPDIPGYPSCYHPEIREWGACSAVCRHRGKPGMRTEANRGWIMPCHNFPCQINTVCKCRRIDVVFVVDASRSTTEKHFWGRKQLLIDIITAYRQIGHDTRFAVFVYDDVSEAMFDFDAGFSLDNFHELTKKIWQMAYTPDTTGKYMAMALQHAARVIREQGRPDVEHMCVVITDGKVTKTGQLEDAVQAIRDTNTVIYAVFADPLLDDVELEPENIERMHFLTESKLHVFSIEDYNTLTSVVHAVVTEWCCEGGLKNTINARFDDEGDIYVNGEFQDHVTFKQTGVFTVQEGRNNLVALRVNNILNPNGRYFEVWNTAHQGISLLSLPYQWKCTHKEHPNWYKLDYDDNNWNQAVVVPRRKDRRYVGARGQKRLWTATKDWKAFCRAWTVGLCNVTYMPGVRCRSKGPVMPNSTCSNTYDGKIGGRRGEWITNEAPKASISLKFRRSATIREIGILNRCSYNGQAKDISLQFSDGTIHEMTLACNAYSPKATLCDGITWARMSFDPPVISRVVKITILSACDGIGKRKGFREIQVIGDPPCY